VLRWRRRGSRDEDAPVEPAATHSPAPDPPVPDPVPTTMSRPPRAPSGLGLRARPSGLGERLRAIFGTADATSATWDDAEEALIAADVGPTTTLEIVDAARERFSRADGRSGEEARRALATEIRDRLARTSAPFDLGAPPAIVLFVGVNGTGKTTTVAKLGARLLADGRRIAFAAGDTFRAAAIEQLRIWGEQLDVPVIAQRPGADPGAVAFDAVEAAEARQLDAVLVDTAGRLQNKQQLMDELSKVRRVIERRLPGQPRHVLLVLDATTGQNGLLQAEAFSRDVGVTGIVLTKLDGTAKGGVALAVADRLGVPILFAGTGEEIDALAPFDPEAFVEWLFAL
jgi:fused signal recognition particle receptor